MEEKALTQWFTLPASERSGLPSSLGFYCELCGLERPKGVGVRKKNLSLAERTEHAEGKSMSDGARK